MFYIVLLILSYKFLDELIPKIVFEVWAGLSFPSKMTLLYQIAPNVCNFLTFSSKPIT
ncbi:hypothetical protein Hanom_Chr03g00203251 [Helianthus anomalus]